MTQECVGLSEELFLMRIYFQTTVEDINTTKLKGMMKNQEIKRQFFQNLDSFYI